MTAKVLKVGIAGYGVVGKRRGDCVERHPNLKLVAVCDRVFAGNGVLPNGVAHFRTYQQLLQQDLDVLIVCMTNDIAAEVTKAGLNLGLHVFCEKPPGRDMGDIASVIAVEKQNPQCRLMYGFNHRYHDSVQDALKIIRSGRFGNIINMRGVYGKSKLITFNQADWRAKREVAGGGVLFRSGHSHGRLDAIDRRRVRRRAKFYFEWALGLQRRRQRVCVDAHRAGCGGDAQ